MQNSHSEGSENDHLSRNDAGLHACTDRNSSKKDDLSYGHAGLHACTAKNPLGAEEDVFADELDDGSIPPCLRRCEQCGAPSDPKKGTVMPRDYGGIEHWLHERCDFEF